MNRSSFLRILFGSFIGALSGSAKPNSTVDKNKLAATLFKNTPEGIQPTASWSNDDDYIWLRAIRNTYIPGYQPVFLNVKTSRIRSLSEHDFNFLEEITRLAYVTKQHTGKTLTFEMKIHEKPVLAGVFITFDEQ